MGRATFPLAALVMAAGCLLPASTALAHSGARVDLVAVGVSSEMPAPGTAPAPERIGLEQTAERRAKPAGTARAWLALAVAAMAVPPILRRSRRTLVAGLVLALVLLSFESSVHAVHHLGDNTGASECSVAGATAHLAGTVAEPPSIDVRSGPVVSVQPPPVPVAAASQPFRPDSGRAPPSP
jgi:hypothetical protein